jgi:hypothetical protein
VGAPFGARGDRSQTCVDDGDGPNVNEVQMLGPVDLLNVPRGRLWGRPDVQLYIKHAVQPWGSDGDLRGLNDGVPELHRAHPCMQPSLGECLCGPLWD